MTNIQTVAVIGAGIAGLTAAIQLRESGLNVTLFDKGRKPGGRVASRHVDGFTFNHGCQFGSAHDDGFRAMLTTHGAEIWPATGNKFAGMPDMAGLAAAMASNFDIRLATHVSFLARSEKKWHLSLRDSATTPPSLIEVGGNLSGPFDAVILAVPAPQAAALLAAAGHPFASQLAPVHLAPCWALMLGFAGELDGPEIVKPATGPIGWIARENSRPGSAASPVSYTIHASAAWSLEHFEDPADAVIASLSAAFAEAANITTPPAYVRAHRWRYALADAPLGKAHLWDPDQKLGVCGDWCLAGKLEAAYLSGRSLGIKLTS